MFTLIFDYGNAVERHHKRFKNKKHAENFAEKYAKRYNVKHWWLQ